MSKRSKVKGGKRIESSSENTQKDLHACTEHTDVIDSALTKIEKPQTSLNVNNWPICTTRRFCRTMAENMAVQQTVMNILQLTKSGRTSAVHETVGLCEW